MNFEIIRKPGVPYADRCVNVTFPARFVYLAGAILGCTAGEANDWRRYADALLRPHGIIGISPLRCEPLIGDRYSAEYPDPRFGVPRAIAAKNKFDVRTCEITLAFLPKPEHRGCEHCDAVKDRSAGTLQEIAWADEAGRLTIQVTNDPFIAHHPVVDSARGWKLVSREVPDAEKFGTPYESLKGALDGAIDLCVGVLGGYTGGKNV
jgi:hypothetical protein